MTEKEDGLPSLRTLQIVISTFCRGLFSPDPFRIIPVKEGGPAGDVFRQTDPAFRIGRRNEDPGLAGRDPRDGHQYFPEM